MAKSRNYQFLYSLVPDLYYREGIVTIGASGAVSSSSGNGLSGVTKLATGIYQIQMTDSFNAYMGGNLTYESGVTGSPVADGSFVATTLYQITVVGTTNWAAIGLDAGLTPAVGQLFVATGIGGAGTGTATAIGKSALMSMEIAQNPQKMVSNTVINKGAIVIFQTFNTSDALANPASGTIIRFNLFFRNSPNRY